MSQMTLFDEDKKKLFDGLEELRQLSREVVLLLRLLGHEKYEKAISKVLQSNQEQAVYVLSDGNTSSRDVAKSAGVPRGKVERWWREWIERGIGEGVPVRGGGQRFRAKYTLLELAVAVLGGEVKAE